ncbi:MAG TPA: hypothetical protein VKY19_14325 [Ktedonosporobacter sp.]|jgi:hypothetical protein|nr:hypothetical protein [Ktedonosporobacter sp.]
MSTVKYNNVFIVSKTKGGKDIWTKVGVEFPHKNGEGSKIIIIPGLTVSGELVTRPPKASEASQDDEIPF